MIERGNIRQVAEAIGVSPHTMYSWRRIKLLEFDKDRKVSVAHAIKVRDFMKKWKRSGAQSGKMPAMFRGGIDNYPESVLKKIREDLKP